MAVETPKPKHVPTLRQRKLAIGANLFVQVIAALTLVLDRTMRISASVSLERSVATSPKAERRLGRSGAKASAIRITMGSSSCLELGVWNGELDKDVSILSRPRRLSRIRE